MRNIQNPVFFQKNPSNNLFPSPPNSPKLFLQYVPAYLGWLGGAERWTADPEPLRVSEQSEGAGGKPRVTRHPEWSNGSQNTQIPGVFRPLYHNSPKENLIINYRYILIISIQIQNVNVTKVLIPRTKHSTYLNKSLVKEVIQCSQVPLIYDIRAKS